MATTSFSSRDFRTKRRCRIVTLRLSADHSHSDRLQPWCSDEVLHAVAALCSVCLPDMEIQAIYNSLTTCTTIVVLTSPADVLKYRAEKGKTPQKKANDSVQTELEETNCFSEIISGDDSESDCSAEEDDQWAANRDKFLTAARQRKTLDQDDIASVGPEHCVLGCAAFLKLASNAVQITLLAVRKSSRRLGIGRHLMQMCKDPEVVGPYNALVAFSDPKAEGFFQRHGFSDDPILTAQYRAVVDHWENSALMVYVPPFSSTGLAVGSLKSLAQFQEAYSLWRDSAIASYSGQLCVMERLRHELLLLHTKVQSQEELISELTSQLSVAREQRLTTEREFSEYRKYTQKLLCGAAMDNAEKWINETEQQ